MPNRTDARHAQPRRSGWRKVYTIEDDDYEATVHAVHATIEGAKAQVEKDLGGVVWIDDGPDFWYGRVGGMGNIIREFEVQPWDGR